MYVAYDDEGCLCYEAETMEELKESLKGLYDGQELEIWRVIQAKDRIIETKIERYTVE